MTEGKLGALFESTSQVALNHAVPENLVVGCTDMSLVALHMSRCSDGPSPSPCPPLTRHFVCS